MPHNRPITPPPDSPLNNCCAEGIAPAVSVDKVRARISLPHRELVAGRFKEGRPRTSVLSLPYRWLTVRNGRVAVRSHGLDSLFVQFNPAQLEFGHNVAVFSEGLTETLRDTIDTILPLIGPLPFSWKEAGLLRAGFSDLSEIQFAADFKFPSRRDLEADMRNLIRSYTWALNRNKNDSYPTTFYWNQANWTLKVYFKEDEVEANHKDWSPKIKDRCRNVLRVELTIRRQDLRKLGERLNRWRPDLPLLDLSKTFYWERWLYRLAFDFYCSRIRSIHKQGDSSPQDIPLYRFLAKYGGRPLTPRSFDDQFLPTFYKARGPKTFIASHILVEHADPYADHHLLF